MMDGALAFINKSVVDILAIKYNLCSYHFFLNLLSTTSKNDIQIQKGFYIQTIAFSIAK